MIRARTAQQLTALLDSAFPRHALVGFDGFVDTIVSPVRTRSGLGEEFAPMATMAELGERISLAAGKSTNVELYPRLEKLGGNGPILANALDRLGSAVTFVGAVGEGTGVHRVFESFAARATVVPLCEPARTTAIEFTDGKVMLGTMTTLDQVSFERICRVMGRAQFEEAVRASDLVALVNWTMIPRMSAIFAAIVDHVLPRLPARPERHFFFDLADPEKRSADDVRIALAQIARFSKYGRVTLGLNLKEAQQVAAMLHLAVAPSEWGLQALAAALRERLGIATVVVHPRDCAVCASADGTHCVRGPFVAAPLISTGAGDHFNAGFTTGQLLGLDPEGCLLLGVATSGFYVRTAKTPALSDVIAFLGQWQRGEVDPARQLDGAA